MLSSDYERLQDASSKKQGPNLLPSLDPYLMAYRDRSRILSPEHHHRVFDRSGNAISTVLMDGRVIGVWLEKEESIKLLLWEGVDEDALISPARDLAKFLGLDEGDPTIRPYPPDAYVKTPFKLGKRGKSSPT